MELPLKSVEKLQLMQNAVIQAVMGVCHTAHATSLLCKVHWLPVCFQVQCKVLDLLVWDWVTYIGLSLPGLYMWQEMNAPVPSGSVIWRESFLLWWPLSSGTSFPTEIRLSLTALTFFVKPWRLGFISEPGAMMMQVNPFLSCIYCYEFNIADGCFSPAAIYSFLILFLFCF